MNKWPDIVSKDKSLTSSLKGTNAEEIKSFLTQLIDFAVENKQNINVVDNAFSLFKKWTTLLHLTTGEIFDKSLLSELRKIDGALNDFILDFASNERVSLSEIWLKLQNADQDSLKDKAVSMKLLEKSSNKAFSYYSIYSATQLQFIFPIVNIHYKQFNKDVFVKCVAEFINTFKSVDVLSYLPLITDKLPSEEKDYHSLTDDILNQVEDVSLLLKSMEP